METEERGGERNLGDEPAKGVGRGEDGGWGGGWWVGSRMVGREKREDGLTNFAIFLDGLQRKAESRTK